MKIVTRCLSAALLAVMLVLPAGAFAALEDNRLDPNVVPVQQSIELHLDANQTSYSGTVSIQIQAKASTRTFRLNAEEMEIDNMVMQSKKGMVKVTYTMSDEGVVFVTALKDIDPGRMYTLTIDFHKDYNTRAVGLYRMEQEGQGYLFTQFESVDARKAFPCWDEPMFKARFSMTIHIPEGQEAVFNTKVENVSTKKGVRKIQYAETKVLPSYLLCIAAGPLEHVEIPGMGVPGRIYTTKGQISRAMVGTEYAAPILKALEAYFGSEYPFDKLDFIAVPEYWPGAMENPGAVTFADQILLMDSKTASVNDRRFLAYVTAHELAHMWFGDVVTMEWWDDLWLNESFADWLGAKIIEQLYPEYKMGLNRMASVQNLLETDARPSTKPIRRPVHQASDIMEDLGLAYGKGRQVLGMVELYIGPEDFRKGVRQYMEQYAWSNTKADDLFNALTWASGKDLTPIMESFLDQSGYPMITAKMNERGELELSQKRFVNYGVEATAQQWVLPVRVKYSSRGQQQEQTVLLKEESMTIDIGGNVDWVLPDAGAHGYYRWQAPEHMMVRMAADPIGALDERERAAFLGNAEALTNAGELPADQYLKVLGAFASEPRPEIIDAVISELADIRNAFLTSELEDAFSSYVDETLQPSLNEYGIIKAEREAPDITALRPRILLWMGEFGRSDDVIAYCRTVLENYTDSPETVDPDIAGVALRVLAVDGDMALFDQYKAKFKTTTNPSERANYLNALGYFRDPSVQDAALAMILSGDLRPTDMFAIPQGLGRTQAGENKAFEWMMDNYDTVISSIPPDFAGFMPYLVPDCDAKQLAVAREFFGKPEHQGGATLANLEKVAEGISDCLSLRERDGQAVAAYLNALLAEN